MTRYDFEHDVEGFYDLIALYEEYDRCDMLAQIYDEDAYNERIDEDLYEMCRSESWQDVRSTLNDLPEGYDFYYLDDWDGWQGLSQSDFEGWKDDVREWIENHDGFEDDDEEEEEEEEYIPTSFDLEPPEPRACSVTDCLTESESLLIQQAEVEKRMKQGVEMLYTVKGE